MTAGEDERDYFDFGGEPPPETADIERPEGEDDPALHEPVLEALKTVRDPEIPVNLVDLGLIYELTVKKGGIVYVEMTLTTPACPVAQSMPGEVEAAVASVPQRRPRQAGLDPALGPRPHERGSQARTRPVVDGSAGRRGRGMTIEINGMAHVILTVSRFDAARAFYGRLLPEFGMKPVFDGDKLFYCVGARTAIGIEPCDPALAGERFVQQRVGLHHLCLRARSREDVDRCAALLKEMNATIVRGPMEGDWAPGYYYVLFEDPDGIRLEVNFVPGAGLLADGARLNPAGYL
jgi:metal-sulfur cluster biosynthetic enzyme/catechol 2,3-dioxygenase-like lactoylglutathione lyase family enzyme